MHKGRSYCFAFDFWCPLSCFWPNWPPYKFKISKAYPAPEPWDTILSEPIYTGMMDGSPDVGLGEWDVGWDEGGHHYAIHVLLDRIPDEDETFFTRWRLELFRDGDALSTLESHVAYPADPCGISGWDLETLWPGGDTRSPGATIVVAPALWGEVEDPWEEGIYPLHL